MIMEGTSDSTGDTPVPNGLLDEHLANLSGAELKVLLFILRHSRGSQGVALTYDHFLAGTGIRERDTLKRALAGLQQSGLIARQIAARSGGGRAPTVYRVAPPPGVAAGQSSYEPVAQPTTPVQPPSQSSYDPLTQPVTVAQPRALPATDALSRRLWDALAASRVLHRPQVDGLRGITVRQWDAEHLVLAPGTMADYQQVCAHRRDIARFLAQAGQFRCVIEVLPPEPTPAPQAEPQRAAAGMRSLLEHPDHHAEREPGARAHEEAAPVVCLHDP